MSTLQEHFEITGGSLVCELDDIKILSRTGVIIFKSDNFYASLPVTGKATTFYKAHHVIIYCANSRTHVFNCVDQSNKVLIHKMYSVSAHYVCNGEIYIQLVDILVRVSDCATIRLGAYTNLIIKGNNKYLVIAYVGFEAANNIHGNTFVPAHLDGKIKLSGNPVLAYRIYEFTDLKVLGSDHIEIRTPLAGCVVRYDKYMSEFKNISDTVQVTDTHIDISDVRFKYKNVNANTEECCICFDLNNMIKLAPCDHTVCEKCVGKLVTCPLCRGDIEGHRTNLPGKV